MNGYSRKSSATRNSLLDKVCPTAQVTQAELDAVDDKYSIRVGDEEALRNTRDIALGQRIDTEITNRSRVDGNLDDLISTEKTDRQQGDTDLGVRITAEATTRENADTALGVRVDTEETARIAADTTESEVRLAEDDKLGGRIETQVMLSAETDALHDGRISTNTSNIETNRVNIDANRSGIAMAVAMSRLSNSLSADSSGNWGFSLGVFKGESAFAGGVTYRVENQNNALINVGLSSSGGETAIGAGFNMEF